MRAMTGKKRLISHLASDIAHQRSLHAKAGSPSIGMPACVLFTCQRYRVNGPMVRSIYGVPDLRVRARHTVICTEVRR